MPAVLPNDASREGLALADVVVALVRDRRGVTRAGIAVRLVEDGKPVDQARTTSAGIAVLRRPAGARPSQVRAIEAQGADQTFSTILDEAHPATETLAEVVLDALPDVADTGPADDLFSKLPLHHGVDLSERLLRWTDAQSSGMSSSDGPRGRLAGRRHSFSRIVPVARPGPHDTTRRYLALVRQAWTHVGDVPAELAAVRSVVPGVDASERESGVGGLHLPVEAQRLPGSEEALAPDAWTRARPGLHPAREANERAHDLSHLPAPLSAGPVTAARAWSRERHEGPPSSAVANVFAWRVRSRFAVRSRVEEVLHVHALRPSTVRPLAAADVARWARVLAPTLELSPEDPAFARLGDLAAETDAALTPVNAVRLLIEGTATGTPLDALFTLGDAAATARLVPGRPRESVQLTLAHPVPREALATLRVDLRPVTPEGGLAPRGESQDEDVRRLAARLQARAATEATGRTRGRLERVRVELHGTSGLLAVHDLAIPLELEEGQDAIGALVDLPGPRRHDLHEDPLLARAAREAPACAASLFHHAWTHPEARAGVGALLGISVDDAVWNARVLGREGGALLVGVRAAQDDPTAQALLADPGDATLVALDTGQSFTDVVMGEGEGADFLRAPPSSTIPGNLGGLGGVHLPTFPGLAGLSSLSGLGALPGIGDLPRAPALDDAGGLGGLPVAVPAKPALPHVPGAAPGVPAQKPALRRTLGGL